MSASHPVHRISGTTRLIAHLGVPTVTFKAPMVFNPLFAARDIDVVVVPMGCGPADYPTFLRALSRLTNFLGAIVTMPHKVTTIGLLDEVSTTARVAGSCNAVRADAAGRLVGDMFDGEGFVRGILRKGRKVKGARALVVGSGGVGSAISASLAKAGVGTLAIHDVNGATMQALAERLATHHPGLEVVTGSKDPAGYDIVINATPLGMKDGDPLPFEPARIAPSALVGEVVLSREITPLLAAARERGCAVQVGTDMLFEQIPAYLEFFGLPTATAEELRAVAQIKY